VDHSTRREQLSERLAEQEIDLLFCPIPGGDAEYLTGFPRRNASFGVYEHSHMWASGAVIRPGSDPVFVVPRGFSAFNPPGIEGELVSIDYLDDSRATFADVIRRHGRPARVGVSGRTWATTTLQLLEALPGVDVVDCTEILARLRWCKSAGEIEVMERASQIADTVMAEVTGKVAAGATELDLASEVDYQLRRHGAKTPSFDTGAFAMGVNDARDASTRVSSRVLAEGDAVSFDFGGVVDGYCSDFGRTIFIGEPDPEYVKCYGLVVAAFDAGVAASVVGATAADVDRATRSVIEDAGYGQWFRHRTGHCIGLDTHERPFLSVDDETPLEAGMAFTIEPSIFWPGKVGARLEDLFVLEPGGCRSLNAYPRDLVAV